MVKWLINGAACALALWLVYLFLYYWLLPPLLRHYRKWRGTEIEYEKEVKEIRRMK